MATAIIRRTATARLTPYALLAAIDGSSYAARSRSLSRFSSSNASRPGISPDYIPYFLHGGFIGHNNISSSLPRLYSTATSPSQGTNNVLKLLESMNLKVAEEYKGFGDVASGLRVFVE